MGLFAMSAMDLIDSLLQRINDREQICDISIHQGLIYERELGLLLNNLKTRSLYKLNINTLHSKLQCILSKAPHFIKHRLINSYYPHSWISHVSHQFNRTPLSVLVELLKKYVIRKEFSTLWRMIVLLLQNGANPLLSPCLNADNVQNHKIFSLELIRSLYFNLFSFIDDEVEILNKISFALSFVHKNEFDAFVIFGHQFDCITSYPVIFDDEQSMNDSFIPTPSFLDLLICHGFELNVISNAHYLSFATYHRLLFDDKCKQIMTIVKKEKLMNEIVALMIEMLYGTKQRIENDGNYLFHLFALKSDWIKWTFSNIWYHKSDNELMQILNANTMSLNKWSCRVRETACFDSLHFVKFFLKLIAMQKNKKNNLSGKELALWMKKYEKNGEILSILFKLPYDESDMDALYAWFWHILCFSNANCIILRLLNNHFMENPIFARQLFNDFCDKFDGLHYKIKNNLMSNMLQLLERWKLNGCDVCNNLHGLKSIFDGAACSIFEQLTNSNNALLSAEYCVNVIFDIWKQRGKYIQQRHKNMMIVIGKWLIANGYKQEVIQFIICQKIQCQQMTDDDDALRRKQLAMIKQFEMQWNLC